MRKQNAEKQKPRRGESRQGFEGVNICEDIHVENHSTNVIPFKFENRQVRTVILGDQPWFVASDVSAALLYSEASAMTRHLDEDEKGLSIVQTLGGDQELLVINESGLYSAILRSRKAEAKRFKKWVTAEVLPAIRKHGRYEDEQRKMPTLVNELIGMSELNVIKGTIRDKAKDVQASKRRSFHAAMCSRLHTRFNVPRLEMIPADQFEAACNFVAAYAMEGEWMGSDRVDLDGGITLTRAETQDLYLLMSRFAVMHKHKDDFLTAARAFRSEVFMTMFDQLRDGALSFRVLDRRRDEIYAAYRSFGAEGGYVARGEAA